MINETTVAVGNIQSLASTINEVGKSPVQDSYFIYAGVVILIILIALISFFMMMFSKMLKSQISEQKEHNEKFLDKFEKGMQGMNESVNGIYALILGEKSLSIEDFKKIIYHIIHNTIYSIQLDFITMVDKNNIAYNLEMIIKDVGVVIDTKVNEGRLKIKEFNFDKHHYNRFLKGSNVITREGKNICKDLFEIASKELIQINYEIKEFKHDVGIYDIRKKGIYENLKRGLNQVAQEIGCKMEAMLNK